MKFYYLNLHPKNNNYEVHEEDCVFIPTLGNRKYLGYFNSCKDAVEKAISLYPTYKIDGCYYCSKECHQF